MAFRRSKRFARSRPRSRGPFVHTEKKTAVWQWGNFRLFAGLVAPSVGPNQTGLLIQILAQQTNLFDQTSTSGQALTRVARALEIGGIVYEHIVLPTDLIVAPPTAGVPDIMLDSAIVIDQLDDVGQPVGAAFTWATTTPTAIPGPSNPLESTYPMRIKKRWANFWRDSQYLTVPATTGVQSLNGNHGLRSHSGNIRLRSKLEDNQALCLFHALRSGPSYPAGNTAGCSVFFTGSIYYRARF